MSSEIDVQNILKQDYPTEAGGRLFQTHLRRGVPGGAQAGWGS